jgi:hypothetical protein
VNKPSAPFEPLEPSEFCQYWVPIIYRETPEQYGYRKTCCQLLSKITGKSEYTCGNWLSYPDRVPDIIKRFLKSVDLLWKMERASSKTLDKFHDR